MKTKLHLIIMSLVLLFVAGGQSVCLAADTWSYPTTKPETPFGGGDGSSYDPYRIETAQHLANLAYMVTDANTYYKGQYFVLTNDITLNDDVIADDGKSLKKSLSAYNLWKPIGEDGVIYNDDFMGRFDGCGHTIRGMVCICSDSKKRYNGLFGAIDEALIKNINMEDCYIERKEGDGKGISFGILCGYSSESTFLNCTVSKSFINVETKNAAYIGGLIGCIPGGAYSYIISHLSNCKFSGNIRLCVNDVADVRTLGGIIGNVISEFNEINMDDCSSVGEIEYHGNHNVKALYAGGICGRTPNRGRFSNCFSSMDININSPLAQINACYVGGFGSREETENVKDFDLTINNCAYLGNIRIGDAANKVKTKSLRVCGIGNNRSKVNGCAFYGKFDVHCTAEKNALVAPVANYCLFGDEYKHNVVYSVGNVIDVDADDFHIDQVCNLIFGDKKHQDYYHFETTNGKSIECKHSIAPAQYSKTLAQMKDDDFLRTLNAEAGSNMWGKLTGMSDASLNGLPMPVACGGVLSDYTGDGMSENSAYIIKTEDDIKRLMESVNNGSSFEGKFFKLGFDIRITGALDNCIGNVSERPFKGHLDGCGHAIIGLRKSLFGYMYGTVKNLALVDCDIWDGNYATALARSVGDENNKAEVSNCYVSGAISFSTPWDQLGYASTFAFQLAKGSSIHDCYFKGRFIVKEQTFSTYNVAGIAIYDGNRTVNTSAESPEGIFNCYASFDVKVEASVKETRNTYGITNGLNNESNGNYFVCSDYRVSENYNGGKKLGSESELNGKFNGKPGWLQVVYRPLLVSAKHYMAKSPDGAVAYFDAIPEANPKKNYFYNISIDDPYSDVSLWQLPNMAVYVPNEKKDYITTGYLDQSADFQYNRSADATATAGQLRYDLTQTDKGYHMICLPGVVERDDLPDGAKVMIIGKIQKDGGNEQVNVVMVDTIPAGVPCMLYVPTTTVTTGTTIPLVMRSGIVSTPTVNATYSDFKGTFSKNTNVPVGACTTAIYSGDNNTLPCFVRNTETTTANPFTAWLEGATGNVQIVDYILLDEENEAMTVTLSEDNAKNCNIKMRRALKKDDWNTICLPYSLTSDEISPLFGSGTKVETFSDLEYNSETNSYTMKFIAATEITAGTPYFIKPSKDVSGNIYDIKDRSITCTSETYVPTGISQTANNTTLTMQGEYNKRMITPFDVTESENIYVISGDKIYPVNSNVEMKGFRCYFVAKGAFSNAKVIHSDGTSTDLRLIDAKATGDTDAVYDLLGRKRDAQTKGLVIKNGIKVLK